MKTLALASGTSVPVLGQGTWRMGEGRQPAKHEADALRLGLDLGMTLIDTAEMYGDGGAEEVVAQAVRGRRDDVFIVSKAYPQNAGQKSLPAACARSLKRLATDYIDLYLLHWRGSVPLEETVAAFQALVAAGAIRAWGVSNFDADDMANLTTLSGGSACAANQVLYNPEARGIEYDLLPWCLERGMPVMAYSPVGQGGQLLRNTALVQIAQHHGVTPAQIAIAWSLRRPGVVAIPKAATRLHVEQNAAAAKIVLTDADLALIDRAFPPPRHKRPLDML